jgi:tetratricopeptide (TPR) repeat protein
MEGSPESANVQTKSAFGLGQVYFVKSQILGEDWIERANDEFTKVIDDYESGDERIGETASHAYARIGLIAWLTGDLDSAVAFYRKAIEAASPYYEGYYFASIGDLYLAAGRMDAARDAYTEAIRIAEFYGDEDSATRYSERLKAVE